MISLLDHKSVSHAADVAAKVWSRTSDDYPYESAYVEAYDDFYQMFRNDMYRTWVVVKKDNDGKIVSGAAIRESFLASDTFDLSWVFTDAEYERQGHARSVVQFTLDFIGDNLLCGRDGTLQSSCASSLLPFYQSLGFISGPVVHDGCSISYIFGGK